MATPQIFVSHSHADNEYCRAFVAALRAALGDDDAVWYDEHNLGWGNIRRTIEHELERRQHFIAILSPAAVASDWVNDEIDAARGLLREGKMLTVSFVTAAQCDVPRLLRGYKRIELPGGLPYPPEEAAHKALEAITGVRGGDPPPPPLPRETLPPLGPAPAPANSIAAHHLTPMPLYNLGFRGYSIGGVELILPPVCPVPAGVFTMGSDKSRDKQARDKEMPQYPVEVDAFAISQYPVTVAEYARAVRANVVREPHESSGMDWTKQQRRLDHPVVCVSWNDALAYAHWLAKLAGRLWRLPTEAEWEKAARGADGRIYPWGDAFDEARCNIGTNNRHGTSPVGSYLNGRSPYHVQDMAGNVWEWTSSLDRPYPWRQDDGREARDPSEKRILRGGSWGIHTIFARVACRDGIDHPGSVQSNIGFRLVLSASGS